jgi:hypothetical protein
VRRAVIVDIDDIGREKGIGKIMALCTSLALVADCAPDKAD